MKPTSAIIVVIGALGEVQLAAFKAWIASECEGERPKPEQEARRVLADRPTAAMEARKPKGRPWATMAVSVGQSSAPATYEVYTHRHATAGAG